MNNLLDPKRVWIARFVFRAGINKACVKGGKSTVQFEVEHLRTAIAALELAEPLRWRSMKTDPPKRGQRIIWHPGDEDGDASMMIVTHVNLDRGYWKPAPNWEGKP